MAEKLKSILKPIPWFSALKAALLGFVWLSLPFWLFVLVGIYFYFRPFFQPRKLILPFFLTLILGGLLEPNFWLAVFLSAIFFLILGIKDLIFVNRQTSHQILIFLLLFLLFLVFFSRLEDWQSPIIFFWSFLLGISVFLLLKNLIQFSRLNSKNFTGYQERRQSFVLGLAAFFIWQLSLVLLFLPLNFLYQTALIFLASVTLIDILLDYLNQHLGRRKILFNLSIFFVLAIILLASNRWGL